MNQTTVPSRTIDREHHEPARRPHLLFDLVWARVAMSAPLRPDEFAALSAASRAERADVRRPDTRMAS